MNKEIKSDNANKKRKIITGCLVFLFIILTTSILLFVIPELLSPLKSTAPSYNMGTP
jgi:uncharacterized membrane protein